ncbi:MAG: zinc-binding alcohol dehydrogenase [Planctomycetota bacterium]|nr:zinc-binding alcohol dehydrogenase [Planctomycetota bacterium]
MKIQRLVFPDKGRCEVEESEFEERLGPGEILVKNLVSLVSAGTELAMFTRLHRGFDEPEFKYAKYPFRPGYSAVGEVVMGSGNLTPGTRVFHPGRHGTYHKLHADSVIPLPDGMPAEHATFFGLLQIAMTAPRLAPARVGEHVVVIGMGLVGNLCAQLYAQSGAGRVACADLSVNRLEKARACGLIEGYNVGVKPLAEWVKNLGERGANIVVEAVGLNPTIDAALKAVAPRGLVVLLGSPRHKMEIDPYFDIHVKGIAVIGAHGKNVDPVTRAQDKPLLMEWLRGGKIRVEPLITQRMPFAEGLRAYEGLRDKPDEYLGVILTYP